MRNRSLLYFVLFSFFDSLQPVLVISSFFLMNIGISNNEIFMLKAIFFIAALVFDIPSGIAIDQIGPKATLIFAKLCEAFGVVVMLITKSWYLLSFAMILFGISIACVSGARAAMSKILEDSIGIQHQKSLAYANFSMLTAFSLTLVMTGFGSTYFGEKVLLILQVVACILTIIALRKIYPNNLSNKSINTKNKILHFKIPPPKVLPSILQLSIYIATVKVFVEILPILLQHLNINSVYIGFALAIIALLMAILSWIVGNNLSIFKRFLNESSIFLIVTSSIFIFIFENNYSLLLGLILFIMARTFGDILLPSKVLTNSENDNNGTNLSIANTISTLLAASLAFVFSFVNNIHDMFLILFLVPLVGYLYFKLKVKYV
jgi:DHA1 family tetracycline resistance protein-like MFS transporter